ncbi:DUF3306 domain-containing protein [Vibrio aquaticus]|uniref:DUF3306 domain-containing protein n=1 Tax=Vibrio aquaticus TaxID=2496559 RepID=A0A3S0QEL3_9VIBR|nr:DUF3306 domain-containing protein [Vibrio aquaticus]RTZ16838.1 DUF3306 domain-containing protein [Vibrio aquaticus]
MATNFLSRWSQRKLERDEAEETVESGYVEETQAELDNQTSELAQELESSSDTDSNQAASSTEESEPTIAALLASEAESAVKKAALRKLFLSGEFNAVDGLNDYDHDYKAAKSLSSDVASKLRDWMNDTEEEKADDETVKLAAKEPTEDRLEENLIIGEANTEQTEEESELGQNIPHKE